MVNNERNRILTELYKTTRKSAEHFDTLLADFRKIIFAFNGIIISSGIIFFVNYKPDKPFSKYMALFSINFLFASGNILIWCLEKHYHRYLTTSALVARNIEEELIGGEMKTALAYQLKEARNVDISRSTFRKRRKMNKWAKQNKLKRFWIKLKLCLHNLIAHKIYKISRYIRTYDFLYILPIFGSAFFNFFLAYKSQSLGLCTLPILLLITYFLISYGIIKYNHDFTKRYKLISRKAKDF